MRIRLSQLRRIIKEEVQHVIAESEVQDRRVPDFAAKCAKEWKTKQAQIKDDLLSKGIKGAEMRSQRAKISGVPLKNDGEEDQYAIAESFYDRLDKELGREATLEELDDFYYKFWEWLSQTYRTYDRSDPV